MGSQKPCLPNQIMKGPGNVTLSQKLLPLLDLLQEEFLHSLGILQVWQLQQKKQGGRRSELCVFVAVSHKPPRD